MHITPHLNILWSVICSIASIFKRQGLNLNCSIILLTGQLYNCTRMIGNNQFYTYNEWTAIHATLETHKTSCSHSLIFPLHPIMLLEIAVLSQILSNQWVPIILIQFALSVKYPRSSMVVMSWHGEAPCKLLNLGSQVCNFLHRILIAADKCSEIFECFT